MLTYNGCSSSSHVDGQVYQAGASYHIPSCLYASLSIVCDHSMQLLDPDSNHSSRATTRFKCRRNHSESLLMNILIIRV